MAGDPAEPSGPPPVLSGRPWPDVERLVDGAAVLARPDPVYAPDAFRLVADPSLWVDVPTAGRTRSVVQQRDDLEEFAAHWDRHGFGYWLVWADRPGGELLGLGGLRWLWWRGGWVLNLYVRLARRVQGRGLARRMLSTALDRLDGDLARPTTVVVRTRPTNTAMVGLARRLGFDEAGDEERELGTYRILQRSVGGAARATS